MIIINLIASLMHYYSYAIIIYTLLSWFNAQQTGVGNLLARICEPYLEIFRRFIPPLGMIDVSPIVAILALNFAASGLRNLFYML